MAFCGIDKFTPKPLEIKYIDNPITIGQKLKNRRLELCLLQQEVAKIFNITEDCVTNWENDRYKPQIRYASKVIKFLGYNPYCQTQNSFGGRVKEYRQQHGLSHKKMGLLLEVHASTIGSWENNEHLPQPKIQKKLNKLLNLI